MTNHDHSNRDHLRMLQRQRRAGMVRIDYMPSQEALDAIAAKRGPYYPLNTNSGVLDAIVMEWAALTGIKKAEIGSTMTSGESPGITTPKRARAYDFGDATGVTAAITRARDFGGVAATENRTEQAHGRVVCGARRHRDGQPCRTLSEPGKRRCKWHGGASTGPRTAAGKARSLANLRQFRRDDL